MKLLVQWATKHPRGWVELDSSEWRALAKKPVPVGDEKIDDTPGWLSNVCVQGQCTGSADHVAVEHLGDSVRVTSWNDDPEDYRPGMFFARVTTFHPLKPDPRLGGAINTDIETVFYAGPDRFKELKARDFADAEVRPWSEFVPPPEDITRHGIWVTDKLADAHRKLAVPPSWREWGEDGDVPPQRALGLWAKAKGTVTYYWRGTDGGGGAGDDADSDLTPATGDNYKLTIASTTVHDVTRDIPLDTSDEISFAFSSEADFPKNADWPTGDYRAQLDVNALEDANLSAKVRILRVNSTGTIQETFGTSDSYSTVGTHLYTISSYNPSSGAIGDRYQVRVLGTNAYTHQSRLLTIGVRSGDSYADGPWTIQYVDHTIRSTSNSKTTDYNFEHTVPAGDNRMLVVFVGRRYSEDAPASVTFDGNELTDTGLDPYPGHENGPGTLAYYKVLGSSGSETVASVVVDVTGQWTNCSYVVAVNFTGVDQEDPLGALEGSGGISHTVSLDITTDASGSLLFGAATDTGYGGGWAGDDSQTERWDDDTNGTTLGGEYVYWGGELAAAVAEEYSFGATWTPGTAPFSWSSLAVLEIHAVSEGGTETSSSRAARTAGKVTDTPSSRDARTLGGIATSATRDARTAGRVTDASSDRDARTAGQVADVSSDRDARTAGEVTDSATRDARTLGGLTTSATRDARTAGRVLDLSSSRDAATKGWAEKSPGVATYYYMRGTSGGSVGEGDDDDHECSPGAYGFKLTKDYAAQALVDDTVPGTTNNRICFSWTTDSPEPPTPWPSGDYTAQVDVVLVDPDIVFRIQLVRIKVGDCTVEETIGTSGNFSGTGLHLYTATGVDPGDTGRFQVRLIADNSNASPQQIKCNVRGTNSYAEGPWRYSEDDTRDARTAGKITDLGDTRDARTMGGIKSASSRDARTEGYVTGNQVSATRDARTAGVVTDAASSRDARTAGHVADVTSDRDARTAGQVADFGSSRDARTEGVVAGTQASDTRDARTAGEATASATRDARTFGGLTTSATRDARTLGQASVNDKRGARTSGLVPVTPKLPPLPREKHPDPSEAGGRTPQAKYFVIYSESMEERVQTMFPKSKRKRRR